MAALARTTVVIGIGNEFRRDDGVGWAAVALLGVRAGRRALPAGTALVRSDGDPGRLIELWENTALAVVVDACFPSPARPGRTHRWSGGAEDGPLRPAGPARHSTHGLGLAEALHLGDSLGRGPGRLVVYAVEGADRSLGTGLTPAVARAVPLLVRRVEEDVVRYGGAAAPGRRSRSGGYAPRGASAGGP
ncbi:hydrogenase maturation protease [Streptomyces sp. ICN441]|uniref:hydrogenase maturation protease n=1 Tax=Streptomyces sp. ICN441 TaxID=2558286 RepID=UPI00106D9C0F|nr:hydrogenase maturation protease [Streptomyces sp. ICN441]TFE47866.1 hydrogenase maturation protease [Streptomyces sp. ICN441]